jgi:cob(I)alamin adenosyltransferase
VARIYTRTGDDGTTGLVGGKRVTKDSPLIEACGALDELNALLGVVRSNSLPDKADKVLALVQNDLFEIGTEIATPEGASPKCRGICDEDVRGLEKEIDALENELEPLRQFILPGGARSAAELHFARTVARRAERHCVSLSRLQKIAPQVLCYLNRLSDLCFVLARYINRHQAVPDQPSRTNSLD